MRIGITTIFLYSLFLVAGAVDAGELQITRIDRYKEKSHFPEPVDRIAVVLNNGRILKVPLYAANAIAILKASDGTYFLLADGTNCTMCDEGRTIRFFVIGEGELKETTIRYTYPGTLRDNLSLELIQKTRVFYGNCAEEPGDVVLWYADYIGKDKKWHKQTEIARLAKNGETFVKDVSVPLDFVLRRVASRRCSEVPGVDAVTEP